MTPSREQERRIRELHAEGHGCRKIGADLGINESTANRWRRQLGLARATSRGGAPVGNQNAVRGPRAGWRRRTKS